MCEERQGERSLCGYPEHLVDHAVLCEDILLGHPFNLAFTEHVHCFIALDGPLRRGKRPTPQPRIHAAFHQSMILFYPIGEAVQERAEAVIALSTDYGFPLLGVGERSCGVGC